MLHGQSALVRAVVDELIAPDSVGVVLVGEAGIGKTAIARRAADHLQDAVSVLQVRGGVGLQPIPYGALSRYLGELTVADVGSPAAVLRHFMRHISGSIKGQSPPIVLIDDAHRLDDESALLIMQLATARKVKVLATARQVPGPAGEFARAVKDGLLGQYVVEPLTLPGVRELCEQVLGGPVLTGTVRLLAGTTRGNPLFLTMLLDQGRAQGYLVEENGVWRARGPRPALDAPMADLVLHGVGEQGDDERAALEFLAVAGPVPLASLEAGADRSALAHLLHEQLIEVDPADGHLVSLRHPLLAEAIRGSMTAVRASDLAARAHAARPEPLRSPHDVLGAVASALEASSPVDDSLLLRAARIGNRLHDPSFAQRALGAVQAQVPTSAYLLEAAWAHWNERNYEFARALLDESLRAADSQQAAREATVLALLMQLREGSAGSGRHDDVDRWADLLVAVAGGDGEPRARGAGTGVHLLRTFGSILQGDLRGLEDLASVPPDPALPDAVQVGHLGLLAHVHTRTGRPRAASEALERACILLEADPEPLLTYRDLVTGEYLLALVCRGSWDEARAVFHRTYPTGCAGSSLLSGWLDVIDGSMSLHAGSFRTARHHLLLAVEAFRDVDPSHVLAWVAGAAAFASARAGDAQGARALLDGRGMLQGLPGSVTHQMGEVYFTAALGHLGEPDVLPRLRRIAVQAEGRGSLLVAAAALNHAVVLGDRSALQPLADVTRDVDGEEGLALHRFAAAAVAGDRDALVAVSEAAEDRGSLLLAVRSLEEAALVRPPGAAARGIERKLFALRADLKILPGGTAGAGAHGTRLTRGEQAIVKFVAAGHTNREIAAIQGVSTRTVEGHLYRIFAKLGISSREALQQPPENPAP